MTTNNNSAAAAAPAFELFGTTTSPFVRRVRVVALEKNVPFTLVDVNAPEGHARLRSLTPVWKVPTARFTADGAVVWDSRVIIDVITRDGWGPLRPPPTASAARVDEENVVNAVDEALLSLIRLFYLKKDGAPASVIESVAFLQKEQQRAASILGWLAQRVRAERYVGAFGDGHGFGRAELALYSALQWMRFRNVIDLNRWPALVAFERAWSERPSLASTQPG